MIGDDEFPTDEANRRWGRQRFNSRIADAIVSRRGDGETYVQIATALDIDKSYVWQVLSSRGLIGLHLAPDIERKVREHKALALHKAGKSQSCIAETLSISASTVRAILRRNGIAAGPANVPSGLRRDEVLELIDAGASVRHIAKTLKISPKTIKKLIENRNS